MDVTVSVHDWKSLSQSDLIMRNLYVVLQIGQTVRKGAGLVVQDAGFRSGSAEIPLILTIKNSQTDTTMYVRNIPMSAVCDAGGLQHRWLAVYPPGDPQNLHFDQGMPRDGAPQVCLSIAVHEDLLATVANVAPFGAPDPESMSGAFGSWRFSPEARSTEAPSSEKVDQLRRSITSLQAEMRRSHDPSEGVAFGRQSLLPVAGGSFPPYGGDAEPGSADVSPTSAKNKADLDAWLKEKERQAQKIKDHVEEIAKAQRRAEDVGRNLQENLDLLAELRRKARTAEAELADERLQLQDLERKRGMLVQEESELQEQIAQRDQEFQDLRVKRDEVDRQLSRALAEQGLQRNNLEASAKGFQMQAQIIAQDIDQSKRHVLELKHSLTGKKAVIEEKQKAARMEETVRLERKVVQKATLEMELDQTRSSLAQAQAGLEVSRLQKHDLQKKHMETSKRLELVQQDLQSLRAEDSDSPLRSTAADAVALLQQKQNKLQEHERQVHRLEKDLKESREFLEKQSLRMAEVHAESTECELKSKSLDEQKKELQKELDARREKIRQSLREKDLQQERLAQAQEQSAELLEELQREEEAAAQAKERWVKSADSLEREVAVKQHELSTLKAQTEEIQKSCSDLEHTKSSRRKMLEDRTAALDVARARAQDLEEELTGTEGQLAKAADELERLQQEEGARSREIEEARLKLGEVQREMMTIQAQAKPSRADELEATSKTLSAELLRASQEQEAAEEEQEKLRAELEESEQMLQQAQAEVDALTAEQEVAQKEVEQLTQHIQEIKSRDTAGRIKELQQSLEANSQELDATRGRVTTKALELEALKQVQDEEEQSLRQELAAAQVASEESSRHSQRLSAQVQELEMRRAQSCEALAKTESEKEAYAKEVDKVQREKERYFQDNELVLQRLLSEASEARQKLSPRRQSNSQEAMRLQQELQAEAQRCSALREELAARQTAEAYRLGQLASTGVAASLEESVQQMGGELAKAQDLTRKLRRQEEEVQGDLVRMKERIKATKDKLLYQEEHLKLQLDTLLQLDAQRTKSEEEVELLTLGLHRQEEENSVLEEANERILQEVAKRYGGSLEEWAGESYAAQVATEVARFLEEIDQWKRKSEQVRRQRTGEVSRRNQQHEVAVQTMQQRIDKLQKEIIQSERNAKSWEEEKSRRKGPTSAMHGLVIFQRPLARHHERRKALLIGVNYANSHAPLKGCVNDVWNLQCLLRHTLQYTSEQLRILVDGFDGRPRPERMPTKANILASLEWLVADAHPGDQLLLVFCGHGAQHPRSPGSEKCESYLVPSDFAEDLPSGFFEALRSSSQAPMAMDTTAPYAGGTLPPEELQRYAAAAQKALGGSRSGYRLVSMLEVHDFISRLPKRCCVTVMFDACYAILPGAGPESNSPATFRKVDRGLVEYQKLRDFMSRPRFLELPPLPVQHTPPQLPRTTHFLACTLHCFSGCRLKEWCAEFPIEGTVQGAFSWAFLKALAQGHFHVGVYQFQQMMTNILLSLKGQFKHVDQQPVLQLSADASLQDVVLWT